MILNILLIAFCIFLMIAGFPLLASLFVGTICLVVVNIPSFDMSIIIQQLVAGISSFALLSIPMFIFAAEIMSFGNTASSLVNTVKAYVGHVAGGLAITVAGACTIFGAISGSSNATVVAVGKPMRSRMIDSGYDVNNTDALICSSAIIAILIPPSILMIMYCVITGDSIGELFIAGIIPGVLVFLIFAIYNYFYAKKHNTPKEEKLPWRERFKITRKSLLAIGFPVLIVGGIYSGLFTPTEAAAVSVLYAVICEMIVYRTVRIKDLYNLALSASVMTCSIFILIAVGQAFSWIIAYLQLPNAIVKTLLGDTPSAMWVVVVVTLSFWIACMFVDQIVALLILLPIFYPIAIATGIDTIYLGIVVCLVSAIGCITPPFGSNLFVASVAFDRPYTAIIRGIPPYLILLVVVTILIIVFPEVSLAYRWFI